MKIRIKDNLFFIRNEGKKNQQQQQQQNIQKPTFLTE